MLEKNKVGVISFSDPRKEISFAPEQEKYIKNSHNKLVNFLTSGGIEVFSPQDKIKKGKNTFGINSLEELNRCIKEFKKDEVEAIIIGCWHWSEPHFVVNLSRALDIPILLYNEANPEWAGITAMSAFSASLWEVAPNNSALKHEKIVDDLEGVISWIKGACALGKMRKKALLLWGGSYCLHMDHLRDDPAMLKSFFIGDILNEGQLILSKKADYIIKNQGKRIIDFISWLKSKNTRIVYDIKMLNQDVLKKQIALYFAAKDRLKELEDENIAGVSIKCQPELSVEYGVTPCFLPAFLPYSVDSEGPKDIIPTVCEGDLKGLLSAVLGFFINPHLPPLFGDLKFISNDYIIISNCGASSIYYAYNSLSPEEVLPRITIQGQCQGKSGGAIGYNGIEGILTILKLIRVSGEYFMLSGVGESLNIDEKIRKHIVWGKMWPHIAVALGINKDIFLKVAGSNHFVAIPGDYSAEINYACRIAGIPVVRIDNNNRMEDFFENL
ncbi:fucose isomerase [candidate division KSB1 bacterium]|nr:MAG: fucose isomerase [candidate division KSB1 bacterium]